MSEAPLAPASPSRSRGALLLVDDNELNRQRLATRLDACGYRTTTASRGREALTMLRKDRYDLVLLDTMMPEMSGQEVLQILKRDDDLSEIPVIMISGLDDIESVAQCIEFGAEDYLSSPFDPILLRARIEALLRSHDAADSFLGIPAVPSPDHAATRAFDSEATPADTAFHVTTKS